MLQLQTLIQLQLCLVALVNDGAVAVVNVAAVVNAAAVQFQLSMLL